MFRSVPTVFATLVLVFVFTLTGCNFPWERSIKLIDVDDKNINLEIDGKKAHIPLPEGYVVADRELYAKLYERWETLAAKLDDIFLCLLVNSDDNNIKKKNILFKRYRYCVFFVESFFISKRVKNNYGKIFSYLQMQRESLTKKGNEERKEQKLNHFSSDVLSKDYFSISFLDIENEIIKNKNRIGLSDTYFIKNEIIFTVTMCHYIQGENDINRLKNETLMYVKQVGE